MTTVEPLQHRVSEILAECASGLRQVSPACWTFSLVNGAQTTVTLHLTDHWLIVHADLAAAEALAADSTEVLWSFLRWNASLPGGVKFSLLPEESRVSIRAEVPLTEEIDLAVPLPRLCTGFRAATAAVHGQPPAVGANDSGNGAVDLVRLCAESGWTYRPTEQETVSVQLDLPGSPQRATLAWDPAHGVVVRVGLATECQSASPLSRHALVLLLLRTSGAVRMVRAAHGENDPPRLEVVFANLPTPEDLAHAFAALSLGWRLSGREAELLAKDEHVAEQYLQMNPWPALHGPTGENE